MRSGLTGARIRDGVLAVLLVASLARLVSTAVSYGAPAWFEEELPPLFRLLAGQPIVSVDPRQYGVVVFLVYHPAILWLGADAGALSRYGLAIDLLALAGAFFLVLWRYAWGSVRAAAVLAILWFNFVPLLYVVAQRMVDAWQLLFVSASLVLFSGPVRLRRVAGVPLAAAALTKLLPAFLLAYLFVRDWRAGAIGVAAVGALLGVGQALYGPLMGFGYPFALLSMGSSTVASWSTHLENNAVRGLVYKVAAGFRVAGSPPTLVEPVAFVPVLNALVYAIAGALVLHLLVGAWRGRRDDSSELRSLELSLAVVVMLLVSPHTAQDYMIVMLPVFTVLAVLWRRRRPAAWPLSATVASAAAAVLVGLFVPVSILERAGPWKWLVRVAGLREGPSDTWLMGSGIGAYQFFGFAGLGLLLAWLVLAWLRFRWHSLADERKPLVGRAPATVDPPRPVGGPRYVRADES